MKNRYNIALLPLTKNHEIITLSNKFKDIADQYLLGDHSLPHVTLCQFISNEDEIHSIWNKVGESLTQKTINLVFKTLSDITFDNATFWIALLPEDCDQLMKMHCIVADIIKNPLNKSYKDYTPHMTLLNTKHKAYKQRKKIKKSYESISDQFILSLGHSDDIGQYTKVIYKDIDL